jgi:phosphoribosylanthranilate isomerase
VSERPVVKICCIASVEEACLALAAGAEVLGLVSHMPSGPGVIAEALIAPIVAAVAAMATSRASGQTFLLTSKTRAIDIAAQHSRIGSSAVQLVDQVPHDELRALRRLCPGVQLVQVIHVLGQAGVDQAQAVAPLVDALLLDSGNPGLAVKELGGTGRVHDWALSRRIRDAVWPLPLFLAGGLNADNVGQAIATVQPFGVDLCSGVRTRGALDAAKLARFMQAVAAATAAPA